MTKESPEITHQRWYPGGSPVMDSQQLAELQPCSRGQDDCQYLKLVLWHRR